MALTFPENYIITGGSGFVGFHLVHSLLNHSNTKEIHILDLIPPQIKHPKLIYHHCDIRKPIDLAINLNNDAICYHLAAVAKEPGYDWNDYFNTNYIGTKNVISFAKRNGIKNIVYTSTMMVYRAGEVRMAEDSLTSPDTAYGISKLLGELELQKWAASSNDNRLRIARLAVVFGKGEKGNFTRLYYALKKRSFFYIGKKSTVKSNVYVKDVARFLEYLIHDDKYNIIYNFAFPHQYTIEEICKAFFDVFNFKRNIFTIPYSLALFISYVFELLSKFGINTSIHHRRIQKLYYSTNIYSKHLPNEKFKFKYNLKTGLVDWKNDCHPDDLY